MHMLGLESLKLWSRFIRDAEQESTVVIFSGNHSTNISTSDLNGADGVAESPA